MMRYFFYLLLPLILFSCKAGKEIKDVDHSTEAPKKPTHQVKLISNNLSEEITSNDELNVYLYKLPFDGGVPIPLLLRNMVYTKSGQTLAYNIDMSAVGKNDELLIVVIEMDSKNERQQMEPVVRLNWKTILQNHDDPKSEVLQKFLGDEDLLIIKKFTLKEIEKDKNKIAIEGVHLFDRYDYSLFILAL